MSRYDPVSEDEAAAFGRAVLSQLQGHPLTPSQAALLARGRSQQEADRRAPTPVLHDDEVLLRLPRGASSEVRLSLRSFRGSDPFLDLRRFDRGTGGSFHPTRHGTTIRARELGRVLATLVQVGRRLEVDEDPRHVAEDA